MGLFSKRPPAPIIEQRIPPLGSGRRLKTSLDAPACLAVLDDILASYREPQYAAMPRYFSPGWHWTGSPDEAPSEAVTFYDEADNFCFMDLSYGGGGTQLTLHPLGSGDARLNALPLIGHWKQRDGTLTSIGTAPGGSIVLDVPPFSGDYLTEVIEAGGYPATPPNLETMAGILHQQCLLKSYTLMKSRDQRAADRFIDTHPWQPGAGLESATQVMRDLANWDAGVLPYIQDLPVRVRAILLEATDTVGTVWENLER